MHEDEELATRERSNRRKLAVIFATPLLIVALATLVYYTGIGIPRGTTNKGELLQPPLQIDDLNLLASDGSLWKYAEAKPGWSLLLIGRGSCDQSCQDRLYLSRQIRTALGKDAERISRVYINIDRDPDAQFSAYIVKEQRGLQLLHAPQSRLRELLSAVDDADPLGAQPLFIVDPHGFVMMYYLPRHSGADAINDLKFLLKYSRDG